MALKALREIRQWDTSMVLNSAAEEGSVLMMNAGGSGVAFGDSAGTCQLASSPSGLTVAGMLILPFVTLDQTLYHRNFHNLQQISGEPAPLGVMGWVVTNKIIGTPTAGQTAYVTSSGNLTPTNSGVAATPKFGRFESSKDADGYAKVSFGYPVI